MKKLKYINGHSDPEILLVNTPNYKYGDNHATIPQVYSPPLGIGYIASHLDDSGFRVGVLDAEAHQLSISKIVNQITKIPNLKAIGLNVFTPNLEIIKDIVRMLPNGITIILGGPHVTVSAKEMMENDIFKRCILVSGEAEFKMREILSGRDLNEIPGTSFIEDRRIIHIEDQNRNPEWVPYDLDELKLNRDFLTPPIGSKSKGRGVILTTRGCPYGCAFCSGAFGPHQPKVRMRSVENIIGEITGLHGEGIHDIKPLDDLFLINEQRALEILTAIDKLLFAKDIKLRVHGRVNILEKFSDHTLTLMEKYVTKLMIGIESGSVRILDLINKGITPEQVITVVDRLTKNNIEISGYFMIGLPTETKEEVETTYELAKKLGIIAQENNGTFHPVTYVYRPYPGTNLWDLFTRVEMTYDEIIGFKEILLGDESMGFIGRGLIDVIPTASLHSMSEETLHEYLLKMRLLGNQVRELNEWEIPHRKSQERK